MKIDVSGMEKELKLLQSILEKEKNSMSLESVIELKTVIDGIERRIKYILGEK